MNSGNPNDKWLFLSILLPVVFPVTIILSPVFHIPLILIILLIIPALIICAILATIIGFSFFVESLQMRLWRRSVSFILFPILVAAFVSVTRPLLFTGDTLSFYPMYPTFERKVNDINGPEKDKLVMFTMDGWLDSSRGFAFDGSDEMVLPVGKQSSNWKKRVKGMELECIWKAEYIIEHYYAWYATC